MSLLQAALCVLSVVGADEAPIAATARQTVERSLPYLEREGLSWMARRSPTNKEGCVSCHRVSFMIWSHKLARQKSFAVDPKKIDEWAEWSLTRMVARGKEGGGLDTMSQMILARNLSTSWPDKPASDRKGADHYQTLWENIVDRQNQDGSWSPEGQLTSSPEVTTRWAVLALASRDGTGAASADSRQRAFAYLEKAEPDNSTQALLLRLLIERKFGEPQRAAKLRDELLGRQNGDGGWAYRKGVQSSDAFATGQSLFALAGERLKDDPAIGRAWEFLARTQREDGSWFVPTSAIHSDPASESRAKKTDEVNSYWGSAWAAIGLLTTLPSPAVD
jgi:hypothetical protein